MRERIRAVQKRLNAIEKHLDQNTSNENLHKLDDLNKRLEEMLRKFHKERGDGAR